MQVIFVHIQSRSYDSVLLLCLVRLVCSPSSWISSRYIINACIFLAAEGNDVEEQER